MTPEDLAFTPATVLASRYRRGDLSPVQVAETLLARIDELNPVINAYCLVLHQEARAAAREAEHRLQHDSDSPPLLGVPVSLKDNIETAGIRTTYGSRVFEHFVPSQDAVVVERLKAAGAVILGKTSLPEFAAKGVVDSPLYPHTRNPWNLDRTAGGSSGGAAAAVASGLGPVAIGNDLAGSVRIPAAFCGVAGLKPSGGRIPYYPNENPWDFVFTMGPIARTVEDLDLVLRTLSGPDDRDPLSVPAINERWDAPLPNLQRPWRIAYSSTLGFPAVDSDVASQAEQALACLGTAGATIEHVSIDLTSAEEAYAVLAPMRRAAALSDVIDEWEHLMDPLVAKYIRNGLEMNTHDLGRGTRARSRLYEAVEAVFADYDLIVTPSVAVPAFSLDSTGPETVNGRPLASWRHWLCFTFPFNLSGHPAVSVPSGWTREYLPVGVQIVGRRFADRDVLAAAQLLESRRPWGVKRPDLGRPGSGQTVRHS